MNEEFKEWTQNLFNILVLRFDRVDKLLATLTSKHNILEGERLYDNQDLCQMLNVSKRTLSRYRSSGELPFQTIYHKTYYKESDVTLFIEANFAKKEALGRFTQDTGSDPEDTEPITV